MYMFVVLVFICFFTEKIKCVFVYVEVLLLSYILIHKITGSYNPGYMYVFGCFR